jgi:hypothetical protein
LPPPERSRRAEAEEPQDGRASPSRGRRTPPPQLDRGRRAGAGGLCPSSRQSSSPPPRPRWTSAPALDPRGPRHAPSRGSRRGWVPRGGEGAAVAPSTAALRGSLAGGEAGASLPHHLATRPESTALLWPLVVGRHQGPSPWICRRPAPGAVASPRTAHHAGRSSVDLLASRRRSSVAAMRIDASSGTGAESSSAWTAEESRGRPRGEQRSSAALLLPPAEEEARRRELEAERELLCRHLHTRRRKIRCAPPANEQRRGGRTSRQGSSTANGAGRPPPPARRRAPPRCPTASAGVSREGAWPRLALTRWEGVRAG